MNQTTPIHLIDAVAAELDPLFADRLTRNETIRAQHTNTMTWVPAQLPDLVVFAETTEEVSAVAKICFAHGVPIIPFGVGSSLEGHVNAAFGGVSLDLTRMNRVTEIRPEDQLVTVEPGVTREQLNEELRATGLHFPIDPGANASIGGMTATRASGTNAVRYGTMAQNVVSLEVVMSDGRIINTAQHAPKSAAGYDLTRLMVGSEGTLGIITRITLKLRGIPEHVVAGYCQFPSVAEACAAVIETIQYGIQIGRVELLDQAQVAACNAYSKLDLREEPTLFFEVSGSEVVAEHDAAAFMEICTENGMTAVEHANDPEARATLWKARHNAYWAVLARRPGCSAMTTDVCVPISRLAEAVTGAQEELAARGLMGSIVGHVGDGNFHVAINVDEKDAAEITRTKAFVNELNARAVAMNGTCTGEHGIGQGKKDALRAELGDAVDVMAAIKSALDPKNILNPGKIF